METFVKRMEVRWADLDPNLHLRHSVYYDYGASCRIDFLQENGLGFEFMNEKGFGPVIFREECVFRKEIRAADRVSIDLRLLKAGTDYSRWTIQHRIFKNETILSAILTLDGAWIDTGARKLTVPPPQVAETFGRMPRHEHFEHL